MSHRVLVTGLGIVSGIGNNTDETVASILEQKTGVGKLKYLDTVHADELPGAEVQLSDDEMKAALNLSEKEIVTRTTLFSLLAAKEAIASANLDIKPDMRIGFVSATTVGGMEKSELHYYDFLESDKYKEFIEVHDCGEGTEKAADLLGIKSFVTTISTACSSAANAIMLGARLIKHNKLDCLLVGGSECLTKFHLNGFNSLMILDKNLCKPFDNKRAGINLGEGAAYLVIESEAHANKRGAQIKCELTGYGNACDAYHQTASSPEGKGATLAMQQALKISGIEASKVDYINAHGTGTSNNDASEGAAIETVFAGNIPPVSSTKTYTGHTTSAAGGIEAVISILMMEKGIIPPNMNFETQMEELSFSPVKDLQKGVELKHVLTNSFGFGGNNTSLIFSKI